MSTFDTVSLIFRHFVSCASPILLLFVMANFKCKRKTAWLAFAGISVFGTAICSILVFTVSTERMRQIYFLVLMIPSLIFLCITTKDRLSQVFFNFFTAINVIYLTAIISHFILGGKEEPVWADALIRIVIYAFIIFIFIRYLREAYQFLAVHMKQNWRVISVIPFLFFGLVMFLGLYPHTRSDNLMAVVFLYVICGFVYFIIYQIFRNTYNLLNQQRENDALKQQVNVLIRQIDTFNRTEEQIRIHRHDMRHLVSNIMTLLLDDKSKEALQMLESFDKHSESANLPKYCKNITVNATLSMYLQQAIKQGIILSVNCDIPEVLPVDVFEFSMVCANAVENAVQACAKLPPEAKKQIIIRCVSKPQLVLEIANTYNGHADFDENHYPVTAEKGHGIGTCSILSFARKYDAVLDYKADKDMFRLRLLINYS